MVAKKKSNFYHIRWNRVGVNEEHAAEIIGVSVEQIQQWDKEGAPVYVERLLLLWDNKNVNMDGWQGFVFSRGVLKHKKAQFRPEQLKAHQTT